MRIRATPPFVSPISGSACKECESIVKDARSRSGTAARFDHLDADLGIVDRLRVPAALPMRSPPRAKIRAAYPQFQVSRTGVGRIGTAAACRRKILRQWQYNPNIDSHDERVYDISDSHPVYDRGYRCFGRWGLGSISLRSTT